MSVTFGKNIITRSGTWSWFKAFVGTKVFAVQYEDDDTAAYTIFGVDGQEALVCRIYKGAVPSNELAAGYTQAQNDTDKTDFETNYKSTANLSLETRGPDGRVNVRPAVASAGKVFCLRSFYFKTADPDSVVNEKPDGTPWGDVTYTMHKSNGDVTTDPLLAVKTVLDFEPTYDHELIGGWLEIPSSVQIEGVITWWVAVVGAPDIPENLGGSIPFVSKTNIANLKQSVLDMDGRATLPIAYDTQNHSGKLRFIFWHPLSLAGGSKPFNIVLETYK